MVLVVLLGYPAAAWLLIGMSAVLNKLRDPAAVTAIVSICLLEQLQLTDSYISSTTGCLFEVTSTISSKKIHPTNTRQPLNIQIGNNTYQLH